jgi:predicted AlkP superfamily pyrophosphatase or phosphodiesterase
MRNIPVLMVLWVLTFSVRAQPPPPRLIVAIIVDQLRYDPLERFDHLFVTNGFRWLTDHGAFMTFAHYNYVPTVTGPGHASFLSGSTPMMHGIVGNEWFDRETRRAIGCVEDQSVDGVGATPARGRASPRHFIGGTFADELRLRYGSRVIGISFKDRGAILPAGKKPTGAYWFHANNGNFITSTYYMEQLPAWVKAFNERRRPADFVEKKWERLLEEKHYPDPDDNPWEGTLSGEKEPVFDHTIAASKEGFENLGSTPFGDELLREFAEAAIEGEGLGNGTGPDLLCVSFSAVDSVGHRFGPYSQEAQDTVLRLDRQLARLFTFLDQRIGLTHTMIILTADHAVAPAPEFARAEGMDGQRLDEGDFVRDLNEHLAEEFGPGRYFATSKLFYGHLFLNELTLAKKDLKAADIAPVVREFALGHGKFQACYTREQLLDGRAPGPIGELVLNGYNAERGGDFVFVAKPYVLPGTGRTGTTHGSPYSYDTHVPVLLCGASFVPGRYADPFAITDIVPTLCVALRMNEPPGCMGRPFSRVLAHP